MEMDGERKERKESGDGWMWALGKSLGDERDFFALCLFTRRVQYLRDANATRHIINNIITLYCTSPSRCLEPITGKRHFHYAKITLNTRR